MNMIDKAWAALQALPPREQNIAAEAILDFAAGADAPALSDEQAAEVARRLNDGTLASLSPADLRARLRKLVY